MAERVDEKILDFINAAEEREARKDIKNGPVKIGNRYYEFEERGFFDEKLNMYMPKDFEEMQLEARKLKYPSENRPDIIKCNEDGSIAITFKLIDSPLNEEHVEQLRNMMKLINKRLNPANVYFEEGILEVDKKNIGYFDFKSSAIDDSLYNFVFFLGFQEKTVMGTFSSGYSEREVWTDVVIEMVNTIKINRDENN